MLVFYGQIHFQDIIKLLVCASVKPMRQTYTYQLPPAIGDLYIHKHVTFMPFF
uniref:Uncharacterized protein n=1 Tax=Rhizophora mucronata TaxID=61149 RepID=A0A2P2LVI5_RHIMU